MGQSPTWNEDNDAVRKEKLELLKNATTAHSQYSMNASKAQGVDRHFFGLSALIEGSEKAPSLYSNELFNHSKRWRVSTSNLTHPKVVNWGFGQVVPEGVGIAYSVHAQSCVFNIVGLQDTNVTDRLSKLLDESLEELRTLVDRDAGSTS
jgi:carnitine O-acetyltransferase